jgi:hypothetical protein
LLCFACIVLLLAAPAAAAPVLRSADIHVVLRSPTACDVTMAITVDGASEIEHRVEVLGDDQISLGSTRNAQRVGDIRTIGPTQSLMLRAEQGPYQFTYQARLADDRAYRCPMWLPTIATDGQSKSVRIRVEIPASSIVAGSMPAFVWTGTQGAATLGHVPAFVRVRYGSAGEARPWDISRVMDASAVIVFVIASAWWVWRRKR